MGLFSKILTKLGLKKDATESTSASAAAKPAAVAPKPAASTTTPSAPSQPAIPTYAAAHYQPAQPSPAPASAPAPVPTPAKPEAISVVDVVSQLEKMAASNSQKLDWKVSIVDLLKLLDIDSSYEARKELAEELGCPAEFMGDSAKMNTWLHKTVLQKIADNGGNIPQELLS